MELSSVTVLDPSVAPCNMSGRTFLTTDAATLGIRLDRLDTDTLGELERVLGLEGLKKYGRP